MNVKVIIPRLGESIAEATISRWLKGVGQVVELDELLLEVETEKVTLEISAPASGILTSINYQQGERVKPETVVGEIEISSKNRLLRKLAHVEELEEGPRHRTAVYIDVHEDPSTEPTYKLPTGVEFPKKSNNTLPKPKQPPPKIVSNQRETKVPMSAMRRTIAERLKLAQNTAASLTTFNEVDLGQLTEIRQRYQEAFQKKHGVKLGMMSFFIKATVAALKDTPALNAEIENQTIIYKHHYDIGVAVATDHGLVVPVIKDADALSFADIERKLMDLSNKARNGKLTLSEVSGGTFSITNGGVYGSLFSTPIIKTPQSGVLGMHNIVSRPIAVQNQIVIRPMMYLALSYDHRLVDGKEAVTFLIQIKRLLEHPEQMLLDLN